MKGFLLLIVMTVIALMTTAKETARNVTGADFDTCPTINDFEEVVVQESVFASVTSRSLASISPSSLFNDSDGLISVEEIDKLDQPNEVARSGPSEEFDRLKEPCQESTTSFLRRSRL